jgi:TPR repeat protein
VSVPSKIAGGRLILRMLLAGRSIVAQRITALLAWALVLAVLMIATSAPADQRRAVPGQAPEVPLFTALSAGDEGALGELLRFDAFARDRLLPWRTKLTPLAEAGDPLAQLWLGQLYDLYPFGLGTPEEGSIALRWYGRAADQHLAVAERLFFTIYEYSLLEVPRDSRRGMVFLERAFAHASGELKAQVALDLAGQYGKPSGISGEPDPARSLRYIEQAIEFDPNNQTAIDWLIGLYAERGEPERAVKLAERSRNSAMLEKAAGLCLHALHEVPCAIRLLQRASSFSRDDRTPPWALLELYTRVCRQQLERSSLGAIDTPEAWIFFQKWQRNCVVDPAG